jgi:1,4-alpha-glucan branching enzyme
MAEKTGRRRVTFTLHAPEAEEVHICGSFNGWDPVCTPMKRGSNGEWRKDLLLPPGNYEYRFRVDGRWVDDPAAERRTPNPFGGTNALREVRPSA